MGEEGIPVHRVSRAPGFDRKLIGELRDLIRTRDVSIVHCHQYTPFLYGRLAAVGTGAKVVFTEHGRFYPDRYRHRSEEHTSELQSRPHLVCRLLLEKKNL